MRLSPRVRYALWKFVQVVWHSPFFGGVVCVFHVNFALFVGCSFVFGVLCWESKIVEIG